MIRGGDLGEFYRLVGAYLRYVLLAGRGEEPRVVTAQELRDDAKIGTDLDAVVRLVYESGPAAQLGIFRHSRKGRLAAIADFALGWGDAGNIGVFNRKKEELGFPTEYALGFFSAEGGFTYRRARVTAGICTVGRTKRMPPASMNTTPTLIKAFR